jgi:hypothetical protein
MYVAMYINPAHLLFRKTVNYSLFPEKTHKPFEEKGNISANFRRSFTSLSSSSRGNISAQSSEWESHH